mgnify:CR=1 FL=1
MMNIPPTPFANLDEVATHLREKLNDKKYLLLFAYNGTGKTRLSMDFKDVGKNNGNADTLYFNAFTEDLFSWDNDLDNDTQRVLKLNADSRFFAGLQDLEMDNRIRPLLHRYADFDFKINTDNWTVSFEREVSNGETNKTVEHIKISRGEENIFIWCFFLAIAQIAIDATEEGEAYSWVKYIYIDDPISSLDDNNAIAVANHLAQLLKNQDGVNTVISSHHTLFFNVMCNELGNAVKYFLSKDEEANGYKLRTMYGDTARFYHVAMLKELKRAADSGNIYTYHFNILRTLLEKTATFHGYSKFGECIKLDDDDENSVLHKRIIDLLSHGGYSLFEPVEMLNENKAYFRKILNDFMSHYRFNPELFSEQPQQVAEESQS